MIKVSIPNNNINERKYIIDVLLNEFLGLEYFIDKFSENYELILPNGNKLIIEDHFFNKFINDLDYLSEKNIPQNIKYGVNNFIVENDIPIIFGTEDLKITDKDKKIIVCGIDIFASSFFMLTRWEEYVNKSKDIHERFPYTQSLSYKSNFLDRPVVNEYIEMLWNFLLELEFEKQRKEYSFKLISTCDVDHIRFWDKPTKILFSLIRDIVKRKNFKEFAYDLKYYIQMIFLKKRDPYDTFDFMMDINEKYSHKMFFFFMAKGLDNKHDNSYKSNSQIVKKIVKSIIDRGHKIGIHPTYHSFKNRKQLEKEIKELEQNFNLKINFGRQHYLRFEVPTTWQNWEDNNMLWDSSMCYSGYNGFRCGVCYEFSVFNILTKTKLQLKEKPLIVMDANCLNNKIDYNKFEKNILSLKSVVKKYNGEFILLWHNSSFNTYKWKKFSAIYEKILKRV